MNPLNTLLLNTPLFLKHLSCSTLLALSLTGCQPEPVANPVLSDASWALADTELLADLHSVSHSKGGSYSFAELLQAGSNNGCQLMGVETGVAEHVLRQQAENTAQGYTMQVQTHSDGTAVLSATADPKRPQLLRKLKLLIAPGRLSATEHIQKLLDEHHQRDGRYPIVVAGPGRLLNTPAGNYPDSRPLQNGWDGFVANIGGGWDQMLEAGKDVWAAAASSEFRRITEDHEPCHHARTHIVIPNRSLDGVFEALAAGTFWADQGYLLQRLSLAVSADNLSSPLGPGEKARISAERGLSATLIIRRGPASFGLPLKTEIISNCADGQPAVTHQQQLSATENAVDWPIHKIVAGADGQSCYLRARVTQLPDTLITNPPATDQTPVSDTDTGAESSSAALLSAYSNPIRLVLTQPSRNDN